MFQRIETARLILRKPIHADAENIFHRYSGDPEVTRLVAWPRHTSIAATRAFLDFCDAAWAQWPAGPYLIESREDSYLLGSTGLAFESRECAMTGYVLAKDSWGNGYATEALRAMVELAGKLRVHRLYAHCHPENLASRRVLEKAGFTIEGGKPEHAIFPNISPQAVSDVLSYAHISSDT